MKKKTALRIKLLSIEGDGFHLMLKIKVNGKIAIMLIDTGASKTVFDKNRIHNFVSETEFEKSEQLSTGLGTNSMESHVVTIRKITLGDLLIENYKAVLLDLSHVNVAYQKIKLPPIDGVIGSDILLTYKGIIDYGKKQLILK